MKSTHPRSLRQTGLIDLIGLLLTLLALIVTYKVARPSPGKAIINLPIAECNLQHEACHLELSGRLSLEIRIPERPIKTNDTFTAIVTSKHPRLYPLHISFHGIETEITGTQAFFQTAGEDKKYSVQTRLPLCSTDQMAWQADLWIKAEGQLFKWPLVFVTQST